MKSIKYILIICLLLGSIVKAQNNYKFRTFSPEGGFYYDGVKLIQQDAEGFMWIMMDNDVYRFDGYQYKRYYPYFKNLDPAKRWMFNAIAVDLSGKLFIATNNGLYMYDQVSDTFIQYLDSNVKVVKVDKKNNIWINQDNHIYIFDKEAQKLTEPIFSGKTPPSIINLFDTKTNLFATASNGQIFRYDYEQNDFYHYFDFPKNTYILELREHSGKLWALLNKEGLYKIDIASSTIEEHFNFFYTKDNENIPVKTLHIDKHGTVWIGTQRGLYLLNPQTKEYTLHLRSKSDIFSLPNNSIWTITEDKQRNIWLGTYTGGVCYVNLDENNRFKSYTVQEKQLNHNVVSGFSESENYLWVATEGGGINELNKHNNTFSYIKKEPNNINSLSFNNIKSIVADSKENLWISMFRGGLDYYDRKQGKFTHFKKEENNKNSLVSNDLRKIILDEDKGLWIAYQLGRLVISYYSFQDKTFTHYYFDKEDSAHFIFDFCRTNNQLCIITHQKLYTMNLTDRSVKTIPLNINFYINAQTLCPDGNNNLWIGTIANGLIKYNTKTEKITVLDDILKFNVSSIYSICTDDDGNLWMGSDNGLFKYDINENKFSRFDKKDGVQGQVYYPLSCMKSKSGDLYFGGTNGFTIINPKAANPNMITPKVIISDFFIDNVSVNPPVKNKSDFRNEEIILNHNQTNFGFKFSSDNYLIPEKNRFKFRLKGYDDRWIETNASNRTAFYSKVPPGDYNFEILAANNDGIWSTTPTIIKIKRLPAPWLSKPAYITYIVLIISILLLILRYYNQQKKLKLQLYIDSLDKQKKDEIHESQLRFFTNISHDFRTPLSLIIAALDRLRQEGMKEYYYKILNGNAQRLLNLVNDLMDFRTVENGKMELKLEQIDVNTYLKEIAYSFQDYAKQRNIKFQINCSPELPTTIYIDKDILEKIVMNLLNNAFKYTKDGGSVSLETYSDASQFKSQFENNHTVSNNHTSTSGFVIAVRDTGIGITKESISSVFERFYKVKTVNTDAHLGTGIGLALVKSLVLLHKGSLTIFSEREKGTDMLVSLPTDASIYKEEDFIKKESKITQTNDTKEVDSENLISNPSSDNLLLRNKKRILLAEDNEDLRRLIADFLSDNYEIVEAENGLIASKLIDEIEVDMIISDIMMPQKDGITFCRETKENINVSHIPFILLTAKTGIQSKIEGADSGADLYFEKPVDLNLLLLTIQNIFKQQQQLKEHYAKNYFADSTELSTNEQDNKFLKKFIEIIDANIDQSEMDVNYIASELSMSRSKLYTKIKDMTDKSVVEFILSYRLRKAARLIVEQNIPMREVMEQIGIESQSYFTRAFKKEFGDTPTAFASKHRKVK